MSTIDQQFVEYIVKTLVSNPDDVQVERTIDEKGVLLALTVNPEDVGRVIGRRGATAQSIRTLLRALGTKNDARYNLKIMNSNGEAHESHSYYGSDESTFSSPEPMTETTPTSETEETSDEAVESSSELAEKTRAELADLDDLDI